jgi:hypothetical protein
MDRLSAAITDIAKTQAEKNSLKQLDVANIQSYSVSGKGFHASQTYKYGRHLSIGDEVVVGITGGATVT